MAETTGLALIFLATLAAVVIPWAVLLLVRRPEPIGGQPVPRVLGPLTEPLAAIHPSTAGGRESTRRDLLGAGYFATNAFVNFQAVRSLLFYVPLIASEFIAVMAEGWTSIYIALAGLAVAVLGSALPRVIVGIQAAGRAEAIRRGLPVFMDTLGLTLSSGVALMTGFRVAGHAIRRGHPVLAEEVEVVSAQADLRSPAHALELWKARQPIPELGSLVFLIGQADRFGTDVTKGLFELSSSLQVNARQRAEAAANRSNFYMLFPTVLCLMVAAGITLAGPGIVQLYESQLQLRQEIEKNKQTAKDASESSQEQMKRVLSGQPPTAPATNAPPASPTPPPPDALPRERN